jgi:hypothetical protein
MKSLKLILLLLFVFIANTYSAKASHMMGAQMYYKNIGKYKYEVYADYYRDCRGIAMPTPTFTIKGVAGCSTTKTDTFKLVSITNITPTCASAGQVCYPSNTTSSGRGYEKHTFKTTIDLSSWASSGCCQVLIGTGQCCRNSEITTGASAENFWVWCMIDLCKWYKNSSPVFQSDPLAIIACNQPLYSNATAFDYTDNDSLVFELTDPMKDWANKTTWSTGKSSKSPFSDYWPMSYNKSNGPDPNNHPPIGTYLDPTTGSLIFTPTDCAESTISAVRISEYHKDSATGKYVLVGYVTRDWQTNISTSSANNPPSIHGPDNIYLIDSTESSFLYNTSDIIFIPPPPITPYLYDTVKLKMLDFKPLNSTNATFKLIDPSRKQPSGLFTWKPIGMYNKRPYISLLEARDNGCNYNAFYYKPIKIHVRKKSELSWVEGVAFMDINKNCKRDSFEYALPGAYISANKGKNIAFTADSVGHFAGWLLPDTCNFKVYGSNYSFTCTKGLKLVAGKSYSFDLGGLSALQINGTIYTDTSKNCKVDSLEARRKNHLVYTVPGNYSASTDSKGQWQLNVPAGEYKIVYSPKLYTSTKCPSKPHVVNHFASSKVSGVDIAIEDTANISDVSASLLSNSWHRRGFNSYNTVVVKNNGNTNVSGNYVWIKFNKKLKYVSSSSYVSKTDSTIKFSVSALKMDEEVNFKLVLYADTATCKLNDTMTSQVWLDTTGLSNDFVKTNNYTKVKVKIVAAVDPNEKQEHSTNGYAWRDENKLRYFVQFQNTGTDTAVNITVIDTLHYALLGKTLNFNGASHPYEYSLNGNVLKVTFANIYLVDTSVSKDKSIGHFEFSIDIDPAINKEIKFSNRADIFFDFAKDVKTNKKYITYTSLVKTGNTDKNIYCGTDTIKVSFSSKFSFKSGNKFKLILSDASGSFNSGTKLLDSSSSTSSTGSFKIAIPSGVSSGNSYKLMTVSTNPSGAILEDGVSNRFSILSSLSKPTFEKMNGLFCGKDSVLIPIISAYNNFKLYDDTTFLLSTNKTNPKVKLKVGTHKITVKSTLGSCSISSDTLKFFTDTLPIVKLSSPSHNNLKVCAGDTVTLSISGCKKFDLYDNTYTLLSSHTSSPIKNIMSAPFNGRWVIGYSEKGCSDTSNTLIFTKYSLPTVTLTISDADFEICAGYNVIYTGKGATTYQLFKNDTIWLAKFTNTISSAGVKTTSKILVKGTDNNGCTASSNTITLKTLPLPDVKLTCTDADLKICKSVSATFGYSGSASYRFYKNNSFWLVPTSNPYTTSSFIDKDEFFIQGTGANGCVNNSNKIRLRLIEPKINLTLANSGTICIADTVHLNFSGGVSYDIFKNNTKYQTIKGQSYSSLNFNNGDVIFIEGTDSFGCVARSSPITIILESKPTITISNPDTDNTSCMRENVNIDFSGGVSYNLYKNSAYVKTTFGNTLSFSDVIDKDEFYAIGFSSNGCSSASNKIKLTILPLPIVTITNPDSDNTICQGETVLLNLTGATVFNLYKNNTLWKTNASSPVNFNDVVDKDKVYCKAIGTNGCSDSSNILSFTVWPIPAKPSITKSGTVLSSSYTMGNQWYEGTSKLTGATAQKYSPVKTATYFVEHTDANGCLSPMSDGLSYSVSISKIKLKGLKIYPNPASDYLIIETGESGKFQLSLIDITGKLVKEESFTGNRFEWQLKPAKGIYTLKIVNQKGETENVVVEFK